MVAWQQVAAAAPELADQVRRRFAEHRHHTMATLRADGSPRISGTEVAVDDDGLVLGMMPGTRRAADLRRDPRVALHSHSVDPPEGDPAGWPGEAKVAGTAVVLSAEGRVPADAEWFLIDVHEVVLTHLDEAGTALVIESWTPGGGYRRAVR